MEIQNNHITAQIIADSQNLQGDRITTMLLIFPRIVLAEFNTHRMISKNSASSRALPFKKMIKMVQETPFIPTRWMKEHRGMQGNEYFTYPEDGHLNNEWDVARDNAVYQAEVLHELGLTKQICNRLLEPFLMHTVLATATHWDNFFALRAHQDAEIHIQELAYKMLEVYNNSTPRILKPGEWHIPFGNKIDEQRLEKHMPEVGPDSLNWYMEHMEWLKVKIATARCARTSYLNFDGTDDYGKDLELHDRLLKTNPKHASPAEHCARAMNEKEYMGNGKMIWKNDAPQVEYGWSRNFKGFLQYRTMLSEDTATDERVLKNNFGNVISRV